MFKNEQLVVRKKIKCLVNTTIVCFLFFGTCHSFLVRSYLDEAHIRIYQHFFQKMFEIRTTHVISNNCLPEHSVYQTFHHSHCDYIWGWMNNVINIFVFFVYWLNIIYILKKKCKTNYQILNKFKSKNATNMIYLIEILYQNPSFTQSIKFVCSI